MSNKPVLVVRIDVTVDDTKIIEYYQKHKDIEVGYRYHKTTLGLGEYQVQSLKSIQRFWSMVCIGYTFLELYRVSNKKKLEFMTLGDTLGYLFAINNWQQLLSMHIIVLKMALLLMSASLN